MPTHGTALNEGQTAEFVSAGTKALILIANRLGPDLAHNWAGNGEAMQRAFLGALMPPEATATAEFKVWKTIKLGTTKNADGLRKALKSAHCRIGDWANDMLGRPAFTVSAEETEVDLVVASVAELGFKDGAMYRDICARIVELGYALCPAEVGPELRRQYLDQPRGEWLRIAMEAITDSDGSRYLFAVVHVDDELWLNDFIAHPGNFWCVNDRFVFLSVRRK